MLFLDGPFREVYMNKEPFHHKTPLEASDLVTDLIQKHQTGLPRVERAAWRELNQIADARKHSFGCSKPHDFICNCGFEMAHDYVRAILEK
jgi:hypothetical protein